MRRTIGSVIPAAVAFVIGLAAVSAASGQTSRPERERSPDRPKRGEGGPRHGGRGPESRPQGGHDFGLEFGLGRWFSDLAPEDRSPLRPGEIDELLVFAQEQLPRVYAALSELRERNPRRFERRAAEFAPRLRYMKQVFERSPEIGRLLRTHSENMVKVWRDAQTLRKEPKESAVYASALQAVRDKIAENVRLEIAALRIATSDFQANRAQWIERRTSELTQPDADLLAAPERLRDAVAQARAATGDAEKAAARARLVEAIGRHIDTEMEAARQRIADLEGNAADEVDARVERVLKFEPGHGRGRHGGDRTGDTPP